MVPGPFCGGAREEEGEETSGSENEARLVAAGPLGHETHLVAAGPPGRKFGGTPQQRRLPDMASAAVQALRQLMVTTSSQDPTRMVKETGATAQNRVGAVVERLKG
jgi:hypothetical protein